MNRILSILFLVCFSSSSFAGPACPANGHVSGTEEAEGLASIIGAIEGEFVPEDASVYLFVYILWLNS